MWSIRKKKALSEKKKELPDWIRVYKRPASVWRGEVIYVYQVQISSSMVPVFDRFRNQKVNEKDFVIRDNSTDWHPVAIGKHYKREYSLQYPDGVDIAWGMVRLYDILKDQEPGWVKV